MGLLARFRESAAMRRVQAALAEAKDAEHGTAAARRLSEVGTQRCVPVLCDALAKASPLLQVQAAHALAAIQKRHPTERILHALNTAVLNERQRAQVRQAAIEGIAEVVDARHAGSLIEVLKSPRSPVPVRAAALQAFRRLGYPEVFERLVESTLFSPTEDPRAETRRWAVRELASLDDPEKLTKIHEIIHGRRKLHYRAPSAEAGHHAALVRLMAQLDPKGSQRFLHMMADDENPAIRKAAAEALQALYEQGHAASAPPPA